MYKLKIIIAFISLSLFVNAQEGLKPMLGNANLIYPDLNYFGKQDQNHMAAKTTATISLPFLEDFHYACNSVYPSQNLWSDSSVYVNTGMARAPLSLGVATFDGLNKNGFPYKPNQVYTATGSDTADILTSQPINLYTSGSQTLQVSDSVALIFYYQQTGNGESPEAQDSLMVDFYLPNTNTWINRIWSLKGNLNPSGADTIFKRVFIWMDSAKYFQDGFRFRFRNKAQANGNFDNWHIDHILIDKGRSKLADTAWNDLSIAYVPSSFLKNYSSMPWYQYNSNPSKEMGTSYSNYIRYNGTSTVNTTYECRIFDGSNTQLNYISYGASNLPPFKPAGWQHNNVHSNPNISYTFATMPDSADFTIKHYMQSLGGDVSIGNDTAYQYQRFRNYYAYDDGSCETGYYILGTGGKLAVKYDLNVADTLRGIRIYFDPVGAISTYTNNSLGGLYKFKVNVYSDASGFPGTKIFTSDSIYPKYSQYGHNVYADYKFATPLLLNPGVCYIGIQQYNASGLTIGFDKNYNSNSKLFYDSGFGWTQSGYYGSLMLRPLVGREILPPVGIQENNKSTTSAYKIYPNPSSNSFRILSCCDAHQYLNYSVYSIEGKILKTGSLDESTNEVSTSDLKNGVYILEIKGEDYFISRQRLIIQH